MLGDILVSQTMLNIRTINATLEKIISSWIAPNKKKTMQIQKSQTQWRVKLKKWKVIQCKVDVKNYELPNSHLIHFNNVLLQLVACAFLPKKKHKTYCYSMFFVYFETYDIITYFQDIVVVEFLV